MVEKNIVLETIKKMYASGLSDEVIESTLKDIGLGEKEIAETMAAAKSVPAPDNSIQEGREQNTFGMEKEAIHEKIAAATAQKIRQHIEEKSSTDSLQHSITQAAVAGQDSRLTEITERLNSIERKINSISGLSDFSGKVFTLDKKLSSIESDVSELKAISNALKSLLEKVLDTDRSVLSELEGRK